VDKALEILVRNATKEFGFAPRDVYNGVLLLPKTRWWHAKAMDKLKYPMYPVPSPVDDDDDDSWEINFKSARIAKELVELMWLGEDKHFWETYDLFRKAPESSNLAGWVFEAIVHRMLSDGRQSEGPTLRPIPMASNNYEPPTFSAGPFSLSSSTPDAPPSSLALLCARTKVVTRIDFTHELSNVTLDNDRYYVPTTANNTLFDSFTIDHDLDLPGYNLHKARRIEQGLPPHPQYHGPCTRASRGGNT